MFRTTKLGTNASRTRLEVSFSRNSFACLLNELLRIDIPETQLARRIVNHPEIKIEKVCVVKTHSNLLELDEDGSYHDLSRTRQNLPTCNHHRRFPMVPNPFLLLTLSGSI